MDRSTLSVVIPNYNHGKYLKSLLPSILSQTRPADEIIIVDDGSVDDSVAIVEEIAKKNPSIRLFKNEKNSGAVYSLNRAFDLTTSEYVTFPSADNLVLQGMYERSMDILCQYPEAGMCCSDPVYFDEKTGKTHTTHLKLSESPCYFSPNEVVDLYRNKFFCPGNICHTTVVKREAIASTAKNGLYFDPILKWHCDFYLMNAIAFRHGTCYVPGGFGVLRLEANTYSAKPRPWKERRQVYINMLEILDRPINRDVKARFRKSGILAEFTYSMLRIVSVRPKYFGYFTSTFTSRAVKASVLIFLHKYGPMIPFARRVYRFLKRLKAKMA